MTLKEITQLPIKRCDAKDSVPAAGFKNKLTRCMRGTCTFLLFLSTAMTSVMVGVTSVYNNGLRFGGPSMMVIGWLIVGVLAMTMAFSIAEISSAYPSSDGLYYWSAKLSDPSFAPLCSWITAWFNIFGLWALTASLDYALADLIKVIILLSTGGKNGGGYEAPQSVVTLIFCVILAIHAIINSLLISWLPLLRVLATIWNAVGVITCMILIPIMARERVNIMVVFTHFSTDINLVGFQSMYCSVLALLMSLYTLIGYDPSTHMKEAADQNGPKEMISTIVISTFVGFGFIIGISYTVMDMDIPSLFDKNNAAGGYAIAEILYEACNGKYGSGVRGILCLGIVAISTFFSGMNSLTNCSRMVDTLARDGALPRSLLRERAKKEEVEPINNVCLSACMACLMGLLPALSGSTTVFKSMLSIATIGLFISYAMPIFLRLTLASKTFVPGKFNLGRFGIALSYLALAWVAIITVMFSLPVGFIFALENSDPTPIAVFVMVVFTAATWFFSAKNWFKGPITDIDSST